jgi:hypothetical protein
MTTPTQAINAVIEQLERGNYGDTHDFAIEKLRELVTPSDTRIVIWQDDNDESPRNWENLGTMVCWHNRYTLGDEQPTEAPDEYRMKLLCQLDEEAASKLKEETDDYPWPNTQQDLADYARWYHTTLGNLLDEYIFLLPVYLYDHSGITISTSPFSCGWDSGQVGFIYITKAKAAKEWSDAADDPESLKNSVLAYLECEVEIYDTYLRGEVYGFSVQERSAVTDWETTESCGGFYENLGSTYAEIAHQSGMTVDVVREAFNNIEY